MASNTGATFSYAQAAKGLAPSTQTNSNIASSASSESGSKEISTENPTVQTKPRQISPNSDVDHQSKILASAETDSNNFGSGNEEVAAKAGPDDTKVTSGAADAIDAPSIATSESGMVPSESEPVLVSRVVNSERSVKSPTSERSAPTSEADKAKETDDDWEKVSVPSIAAEKELKAAPLPPVNIWLQRKEAQEAKAKEQGVPRAAAPPARQRSQMTNSIDEGRRQTNAKEQPADKDASNPPRRVNSGGRTTQDRKDQNSTQVSPRSLSKQSEKTSTNPPPTADPESWPTPDTTPADERRRSSAVEKNDKADAKSGAQKKSWIQMPFVPTAKFETQLPPAAAARRGGRPSNRGRDGTGRGGMTQAANGGEKSEPGSMGPPPIPNKSGDNERGRKSEAPRNTRASSVPTQGRRAPSKDSNASTFQRFNGPNPVEVTDNNATTSTTQSKTGETVADENPVEAEVSRSSSRKASRQQSASRKVTSEVRDVNQAPSHNAAPSFDGNTQQVNHGDRQKASYEGFRTYGDQADRGVANGREWSRGRVDVPREKSDSWRGSRESRPERGRGGYRGRGNHNGYTPHGSHTYTPPMAQNGFESSKPAPAQDGRSRQASQPFAQASTAGNNRNNVRSQSIPLAMAQQNYYNQIPGYSQALSPTEMNYANYPHQMQGSIMSAMPYNDQLGSYALYSLIITQLDYYFSIDNLCKDMFLRKHMDSQGFVSINVILGFKRIQAMTEGMTRDQLRTVCQQVRNIEFITSDEGEDRLRSRDNWRDFVLPMEERVPAAQNDGPIIRAPSYQSSSVAQSGFTSPDRSMRSPPHLNGYAEPFVQPMSPVSFTPTASLNGANEYAVGRPEAQPFEQGRRSSAASPLSKVQSPSFEQVGGPSPYMTNGHRSSMSNNTSTENVFPDEKIPELKVVVRDPAFEVPSPQANGNSTSNFSNLRGGASSPSQLDHFRPLNFGQVNSLPSSADVEQPPYWTKDGDLAKIPVGPGFVHEDYLALHDKAITQRMEHHLDGALSVLYSFWSTFLVGNFNISMYKEFVELALGDLHDGNGNGKVHLLRYYDSLLASKTPMSERIAMDIVMMAREETGDRRPTFQKLRTAWRNGATNLKTRKRLGDVLTVEEKTEFDKSS